MRHPPQLNQSVCLQPSCKQESSVIICPCFPEGGSGFCKPVQWVPAGRAFWSWPRHRFVISLLVNYMLTRSMYRRPVPAWMLGAMRQEIQENWCCLARWTSKCLLHYTGPSPKRLEIRWTCELAYCFKISFTTLPFKRSISPIWDMLAAPPLLARLRCAKTSEICLILTVLRLWLNLDVLLL